LFPFGAAVIGGARLRFFSGIPVGRKRPPSLGSRPAGRTIRAAGAAVLPYALWPLRPDVPSEMRRQAGAVSWQCPRWVPRGGAPSSRGCGCGLWAITRESGGHPAAALLCPPRIGSARVADTAQQGAALVLCALRGAYVVDRGGGLGHILRLT
jgi:hypothetical protein